MVASSLTLSLCAQKNALPRDFSPVEDVFLEGPAESNYRSVSRAGQAATRDNKCCRGPWHLKMLFFLCGFWGASWPWLQDYNRWPTGHQQQGLLVPSSCHICFTLRVQLPGDRFLTVPHSRRHGYTILFVENRPHCTHGHICTLTLKTTCSPKSPHVRHCKETAAYYFNQPNTNWYRKTAGNCRQSLLTFLNVQISHVIQLNCWYSMIR